MKKPDFVYVTYIQTTPEKAWQALVDPELMSQYWVDPNGGCARTNVSDWKPGSRWEHRRADGSGIVDIVGEVVEVMPPSRLVLTWARPSDAEDKSKHSRVMFELQPYAEGLIRLVVTHDGLERDPKMLAGISGGWPTILSNLKTLLETGRPLPHKAA